MTMQRRKLAAAALALLAPAARAQAWPTRPVRLLVPYLPGSAPDVLARQLAERLTAALGQNVFIENRAGAGGNIGNEAGARAAPDGYTLILATNALLVTPQLQRRPVGFDPLRDFAPINVTITMPHVLIVPPGGPASAAELIASLKARPGQHYASGGNGSGAHLAAELFKAAAGVDAVHVPFRGAPDIVNNVVGGTVQFGFPTLGTATELIRAGRLRGLAVTSRERNHALPGVPALAETLPGFDLVSWFGLVAPAATPEPIIRRVDAAVLAALAEAEFRARLTADGSVALGMPAAAFAEFLPAEFAKWGEAVRLSGAQVD
jgi:tripartite-type tricarboxylate transporter receptor subunit TctC